MSKAVEWAVWRFKRMDAPTGSFDADDARQEALIACWQAGRDNPTVAYRGVVDALRLAIPGYRDGRGLILVELDEEAMNTVTLDTPEEIAIARDTARALENPPPKPPRQRRFKQYVARLKLEALAAQALYAEAMNA